LKKKMRNQTHTRKQIKKRIQQSLHKFKQTSKTKKYPSFGENRPIKKNKF